MSSRAQRVPPDRPEGAHVAVADAIQRAHAPAGDPPGQHLMPQHRTGITRAPRARRQDEIVRARQHRAGDQRQQVAAVGAVAIQEDDHVAVGGLGAGLAGASIASARIDHPGAGRAGDVLRAVGAAAVGDDDLLRRCRAEFRAITAAIASASLKVGMTTLTLPS